jgi:hypothetical protein
MLAWPGALPVELPTAAPSISTGPQRQLYDHISPCVELHSGTPLALRPGTWLRNQSLWIQPDPKSRSV